MSHEERSMLGILANAKAYKPASHKFGFEKRIQVLNYALLIASGALLAALVSMASLHIFIFPFNPIFKNIAIVVGLLSQFFALASLLCPIIVVVWHICKWKDVEIKNLTGELQHDRSFALMLARFDRKHLEDIRSFLFAKLSRVERRVGLLFGTNAAAFSILAMVLSIAGTFGKDKVISYFYATNYFFEFPNILVIIGLSAFLGISLGALVSKGMAARYAYHIEIIELALRMKQSSSQETV